jgi:hypothetical protein
MPATRPSIDEHAWRYFDFLRATPAPTPSPEADRRSTLSPELLQQVSKYREKNVQDVEELDAVIENATGALVDIPFEKRARLAQLRTPIFHLGLYDSVDEHVLRLSLFDAAGQPLPTEPKRAFRPEDRSTWSLDALQRLGMGELAELQIHAGPSYRCVVDTFIRVLTLNDKATNNVVPFHENFFPVDKSSLQGFTGALKFRLLGSVFESGNAFNTREQLQDLRALLFPEAPHPLHGLSRGPSTRSYELTTSPLNAVTLPDAARAAAAIPMEAAFFSFCFPAAQDVAIPDKVTRSPSRICSGDPFVKWLTTGAFIYFDYQFDVIGINAVSFEECGTGAASPAAAPRSTMSALCLGDSSPLPRSAIQPLHDGSRWCQVSEPTLVYSFGFGHFTWINPSEFLGDHIFPMSGGFAYLHSGDVRWEPVKGSEPEVQLTGSQKSRFFPVIKHETAVEHIRTMDDGRPVLVPKLALGRDPQGVLIVRKMAAGRTACKPILYNTPLHIDELAMDDDQSADGADKFGLSSPEQAIFAGGASAAYGLPQVLGYADESDLIHRVAIQFNLEPSDRLLMIQRETASVTAELLADMKSKSAVWLLNQESPAQFSAELQRNAHYVLHERARTERVLGNNGVEGVEKDTGHDGWDLARFHAEEPSRMAQLTPAEVAALRLYTSSTFRVINGPLRANYKPHPLAATTLFISNALKKLRACHMDKRRFRTTYLWRGMRDRSVSETFMLTGGSELACMSTSSDLAVVASYARSKVPLLLRLKVDSPMELGADLRWVSIYPGEAEVLYPPLTFVKPLYKQLIKGSEGGIVVTIKPSFPS